MGASESKAAVKDQINTLLTQAVSYDDDVFWNNMFGCTGTIEEFFAIISPEDVRQLRLLRPANTCYFFRRAIRAMHDAVNEGTYSKLSHKNANTLNTCVRLFSRMIPLLLETPQDELIQTLLWVPGGFTFALQDYAKTEVPELGPEESQVVLGTELLILLNRLLFLNNFCVSSGVTLAADEALQKHKVDVRFLWKGGIGTTKDLPSSVSNTILRNRVEVLRCLLLCLSGSLYQSIEEYQGSMPLALQAMTSGDLPYTANLFCSLMSCVFTFDPIGYGMPYGSVFGSAEEEEVASTALQVLIIVMDFSPTVFFSENSDSSSSISRLPSKEDGGEAAPPVRNVFRTMLSGLKKDSEIDLVFNGLVSLLSTYSRSKSTYLPNSAQPISFHQELLIFLWHLISTNPTFLKRATTKLNSNRLLLPLLDLLVDASSVVQDLAATHSKIGLLHMCSFILLVLSAEREFVVRLNEPFTGKFPIDMPHFQGCYADLLTLVTHRVVMESTSSAANDSLIDMLLTVLCNISAYVKSFCFESCNKLLHLLERLSRPSWLFKAMYHYHDVFFLLDMLNNLIQYQYEGNQKLVYSILRKQDIFSKLQFLEFPEPLDKSTPTETTDLDRKSDISTADDCNETKQERWQPSAQWFNEWKKKLPLQTVSRLIHCLLPLVESECTEQNLTDQTEVLQFLQRTTMVGLLPVPHPIIIRNYQHNNYTALWFTSYMWGIIFGRPQPLCYFDWKKIRLIVINDRPV